MVDPTQNDYLDLIRPVLDDAVASLRNDIRATEHQLVAKGQTGAAIKHVLELGKKYVDSNIIKIFGELRRVESRISADPKELRDLTVQTLTDYVNRTKSVISDVKRHASGAERVILIIDEALQAMDQSLQLKIRQMDTGLLDLGDQDSRWGEAKWGRSAADGNDKPPPPFALDTPGAGLDQGTFDTAPHIHADEQRRRRAAIGSTAGSVDPPWPPPPADKPIVNPQQQPPTMAIERNEAFPITPIKTYPPGGLVQSPASSSTETTVGKSVILNHAAIELAGASFLILLNERITALRASGINNDEHYKLIADYEDIKQRVEEFLAKAATFAAAKIDEASVVKANISITEGLKRIWTERHLEMTDVGLLGIAATICHLTDPVSVVVAGTIVGGKKVVDALKAAAELTKTNKKK